MKGNTGNLTIKAEQLEWRRGKVIELRARGLSYMEISRELQIPMFLFFYLQYLHAKAHFTQKGLIYTVYGIL
jgi:hypothetical protein